VTSIDLDLNGDGKYDRVSLEKESTEKTLPQFLVIYLWESNKLVQKNKLSSVWDISLTDWSISLEPSQKSFKLIFSDPSSDSIYSALQIKREGEDYRVIGKFEKVNPQVMIDGLMGRLSCSQDLNLLTGDAIQKVENKTNKVKVPKEKIKSFLIKEHFKYDPSYLEDFCK
jgi:hypothetical protein